MLAALRRTGKPIVLVLTSGSAVAVDPGAADAILAAWYPGEAGGTAIAETLAGIADPAGRLPVTIYRDTADLPGFADYGMKERTYRYFTGTPLWPFGHGLSYTRFAYGPPAAPMRIAAGESLIVTTMVENIGARRLSTVMEKLLEEVSFAAEDRDGEALTVDAAYVEAQLAEVARNTDLSKYVL